MKILLVGADVDRRQPHIQDKIEEADVVFEVDDAGDLICTKVDGDISEGVTAEWA